MSKSDSKPKANDDADAQPKPDPSSCKKDSCKGLRIQIAEYQAKLANGPYSNDSRNILGKGYDDPIIAGVSNLAHGS